MVSLCAGYTRNEGIPVCASLINFRDAEMSMSERMVEFANRPEGATCAEFCALIKRSNDTVTAHIRRLEQQRRIFRAKAKGHHLRFFSVECARDAWFTAELARQEALKKIKPPPDPTIREQIEVMARDKNGVCCADVQKKFALQTGSANSHLFALTTAKRLFRGQRNGLRLHWFATEALRDEWHLGVSRGDESFIATPLQPVRNPKPRIPFAERVADESGAIKSVCRSATHDSRYQVGPDETPPALFTAKKYGEYLEPASSWASAAARRT